MAAGYDEQRRRRLREGDGAVGRSVPAASAALLRPSLGRASRLTAVAPAGGATIEVLQWLLPLGRVVSPLDAALDATGALAAGLPAAHAGRAGQAATRTGRASENCRPAPG